MTEKTAQQTLEAQLAVLQQLYVASFPEKKSAMLAAWQHLNEHPFDLTTAKSLAQMAHKLVGSGGLRGYEGISRAARDVEALLLELISNNEVLTKDLKRFDILFSKLSNALDEATAET